MFDCTRCFGYWCSKPWCTQRYFFHMCWLENTSDHVDFFFDRGKHTFYRKLNIRSQGSHNRKTKRKEKKGKTMLGFQLTRNVLASTTSWEPETRAELQKQKSSKRTLSNKPSRNWKKGNHSRRLLADNAFNLHVIRLTPEILQPSLQSLEVLI